MSKLVRRQVLLAKANTGSYNTDASPAAANAVLVEDLKWGLAGARMVDRQAIRSSLGKLQQLYGGALLQITFQTENKGSGTAGTAPEIRPLWLGCGKAETVVASTSVTYLPASSSQVDITLYLYEDGVLYKVTGARGDYELQGEAGGRAMISWTFTGHFSGPTDTALITPSYDSTVPPILIGGSFTIGAFGPVIQSFQINGGLTIETPADINAADGYGEVLITARDVNGSFNPEQTLVATKDFMAAYKAGTLEAFDTGVVGSTAGNRFQITLPKTYYRDIAPGEREGVLTYELPFGAAEDSGDDEISIVYT